MRVQLYFVPFLLLGIVACSSEDAIPSGPRGEPTDNSSPPSRPNEGTSPSVSSADASAPDAQTSAPETSIPEPDAPISASDATLADGDMGGPDASVADGGATEDVLAHVDASVDAEPPATSFAEVYTTILSPICTGCHSAAGGPSGRLDMGTQALAYANLVGKPAASGACGPSGLTRVVANHASESLLYQKVSGTQTCGVRMPRNQPPLSAANIELIRRWIDTGAHE